MTGGLLLLSVPMSVALSDRAGEPCVLGSTLDDDDEALLGEKVREDKVAFDCDRFLPEVEVQEVSTDCLCRPPSAGAIA